MIRALPPLLLSTFLCGCVPALREPPPVADLLPDSHGNEPQDVDRLLMQAARSFALQEPDAVRRAVGSWLRAAAADRTRVEGWAGAAQARCWLADRETDPELRLAEAILAVQSSQHCLARAPESPLCSFWLAVSIGVQARERQSTALDALPRMVELLQSVIAQEPEMEHAGPHRVLAWVYLRAPGWPTGPGDADLGLEHARHSVRLAEGYPPNQLCLAEALEATGDLAGSRQALERAEGLARTRMEQGDVEARAWLEQARQVRMR